MNINIIYVLGCFILWGVLPIYWKLLSSLDSIFVLASRIVWSMVFTLMLLILFKKKTDLRIALQDKKQLTITAICGILVTINWGSYIYAVNSGHIMDASLAYYMNPLISIAIAFFFLKEKLSLQKWIAVFIAFAGILYTILEYGTIPYLSLIIGGSFAIYGALKKQIRYESIISIFIETIVITPFALIYIIFCEFNHVGSFGILHGPEFILLPLSGIITAIPLLLYAKGVPHIPYSFSGILMYLNPTIQLLIGVFLYHENFTKSNFIMFICVWIALILFVSDNLKEHKKAHTS